MRKLRPEDYEKLSQHIVADYLANDTPLIDGVTKVATEMELNPHQIRNLTQLSNVGAHLKIFEKKAGDKIIEFIPADPKEVIQNMFKDAEVEKTASDASYNQAMDFYGDYAPAQEPVEAEKIAENVEAVKLSRGADHQSNMILRLQKVAGELNSQRIQAALEYNEELDKLASEFAKLYGPDFHLFERDALSKYGGHAVLTLNDIRSKLRMDKISLANVQDTVKVARVIDDQTTEMLSFSQLLKSAADANDAARGVAYLEEHAGGVL